MDIVDYINEVDRSNREQDVACFIYTTSRGDYNENIHFCGLSQKRDGLYMQKAPARSETRVGALFC
mgnify:FL=1